MYLQALACGTAALRAVNLLFGAACIPLFYSMHRRLHADTTTSTSLAAVRCCLVCTATVNPTMLCRKSTSLHGHQARMHALLLAL
jgi:hypothetical protein